MSVSALLTYTYRLTDESVHVTCQSLKLLLRNINILSDIPVTQYISASLHALIAMKADIPEVMQGH